MIRAGVQDIQLHPVKKLLFIKFTEQQLWDEVAVRLQACLVWPAFDTTVTGWSMDQPEASVESWGIMAIYWTARKALFPGSCQAALMESGQ